MKAKEILPKKKNIREEKNKILSLVQKIKDKFIIEKDFVQSKKAEKIFGSFIFGSTGINGFDCKNSEHIVDFNVLVIDPTSALCCTIDIIFQFDSTCIVCWEIVIEKQNEKQKERTKTLCLIKKYILEILNINVNFKILFLFDNQVIDIEERIQLPNADWKIEDIPILCNEIKRSPYPKEELFDILLNKLTSIHSKNVVLKKLNQKLLLDEKIFFCIQMEKID